MAKLQKTALELADLIRRQLAEPKIRVAVFAESNGQWRATVYSDQSPVRDLQRRVDSVARELNGLYVLSDV
jgi:hypothetical protein